MYSKKNSPKSFQSGLTLIEVIVVLSIMTTLLALSSINVTPLIPRTYVTTSVDQIIADLKAQQIQAMSGSTAGASSPVDHGIRFNTSSYVIFDETYDVNDPSNFTIPVSETIQISTTFPSNEVVFDLGSGEIIGATGSGQITVRDAANSHQRVITINRYGVVTEVE